MIQCVGSRNKEHPYCSRICCSQAIKNGLKIKELSPKTDVYILYRDIRTYGFKEVYYTKAREKGIIFIRFDEDEKPEIRLNPATHHSPLTTHQLEVEVFDPITQKRLVINPDLVVLSAAIIPSEKNVELSKILKLTLDENGFFLEAHPKLRPLDFASDGIFLAGLCHSPKLIEESILQAKGAAGRAATILCKDEIEAEGVVSSIDRDKCVACLTCIRTCPYGVPFINDEGLAEIETVMCHGCGICAGECPARAIQLKNFTDAQILAKTRALIDEVNYARSE